MIDLRLVSLGALAANPIWDEKTPVRTGHATTSLLRTPDRTLLIDPGLPAQALVPRLRERANLAPSDVSHVFLTSFSIDTFRGIEAFTGATWWISDAEREAVGVPLALRVRDGAPAQEQEFLEHALAVLHRCKPAPDTLLSSKGERADLFPLHGVTPGLCGVLLAGQRHTTLVCGDAIPTLDHLERGLILPDVHDLGAAKASFAEAVEIADFLVLGRDALVPNLTRRR